MAEESAVIAEQKIVQADNEIGSGMWGIPTEKKAEDIIPANTDITPTDTETKFDEPTYLKTNYGYDTPDDLKKELQELKELREKASTPAEIKFANEETRKFYSYLTEEGKEDELLTHLQTKKLIEKAEKVNIENPKEATELLQTYYKFKYKDFNEDEVRDHFNDQYSKPAKPKQSLEQDETEYEEEVKEWQDKCNAIDKRIIRDAKMVKPDFAQFKSQIVLHDISKPDASIKEPTPEEVAKFEKGVSDFSQSVETELKALNNFSVTFKDGDVEITSSYDLSPEEKTQVSTQLKTFAQENYNANAILAPRWVNQDGTLNVSRMTKDLIRLNAEDKIDQKFAQDAANKRLKEYTKEKKNISLPGVNGNSGNGRPEMAQAIEAVESAIWDGRR
jgi:hypothetical protein